MSARKGPPQDNGERMRMVFQELLAPLDTANDLGTRIAEMCRLHAAMGRKEALRRPSNDGQESGYRRPRKRVPAYPMNPLEDAERAMIVHGPSPSTQCPCIADEPRPRSKLTVRRRSWNFSANFQAEREHGPDPEIQS